MKGNEHNRIEMSCFSGMLQNKTVKQRRDKPAWKLGLCLRRRSSAKPPLKLNRLI